MIRRTYCCCVAITLVLLVALNVSGQTATPSDPVSSRGFEIVRSDLSSRRGGQGKLGFAAKNQAVKRLALERPLRVAERAKSPSQDKGKLSKGELKPETETPDPLDFESLEPEPPVANEVEVEEAIEFSPRAWLDLTTTGRTPTAKENVGTLQSTARSGHSLKTIQLESDRFFHRQLLFEEPLHERHGLTEGPVSQLTKSTAAFFAKSYIFPVQLLLKRNRGCDGGEGWSESQGDQICSPTSK